MTYFFLDALGQETELNIFDDGSLSFAIPEGFHAVMLSLDGGIESSLRWDAVINAARHYVKKGYRILWKIDLGLFSRLRFPISEDTQYQALGLALRYFGETIWSEFQTETIGVCLYRGSVDFSRALEWDFALVERLQVWLQQLLKDFAALNRETGVQVTAWDKVDDLLLQRTQGGRVLLQLFCRDVAVEYLDLLARHLPGGVPACILLDLQGMPDQAVVAQLVAKERYAGIVRAVSVGVWPVAALRYDGVAILSDEKIEACNDLQYRMGLCMPVCQTAKTAERLRGILSCHQVRLLSEPFLTSSWQELDALLVFSDEVTPQTLRKLHGFCAAGGTVVTIGPLLGLPEEIAFAGRGSQ